MPLEPKAASASIPLFPLPYEKAAKHMSRLGFFALLRHDYGDTGLMRQFKPLCTRSPMNEKQFCALCTWNRSARNIHKLHEGQSASISKNSSNPNGNKYRKLYPKFFPKNGVVSLPEKEKLSLSVSTLILYGEIIRKRVEV